MRSSRLLVESFVPSEWEARMEKGECPVCGTPRAAFEPPRKKYCSQKCQIEFGKQWKIWAEVRAKVLNRDRYTCQKCGINKEKAEKRYNETREAFTNANINWVIKNCEDLVSGEQEDRLKSARRMMQEAFDIRDIADHVYRQLHWKHPEIIKSLPREIPEEFRYVELEVDHITPVANNGDMWNEQNLQTLCGECHKKKTREDLKAIRAKRITGPAESKSVSEIRNRKKVK